MKVSLSLVLFCTLAASSCGGLSAQSAGADSHAKPSYHLTTDSLETGLAAGYSRKKSSESLAKPNTPPEVVLRHSYYECAQANDGSTWNMQACIDQEFVYQDDRLNALYRNLRSKMDADARRNFKAEEQQWLIDRDVFCKWNANADGQAQRIDANVCSLKMTAARVGQLERVGVEIGQ